MIRSEYLKRLGEYTNKTGAEMLTDLFYNEKSLQLVVTRPRNSKYGDYRHPHERQPYHKITINANLESNLFFITLLHEYAHYLVYLTHKNKVAPHGIEWKDSFRMLLSQALDRGCFGPQVALAVTKAYFDKKNIASGIPVELKTVLGLNEGKTTVSDLPAQAVFLLQGRTFRKEKKLRTRYQCKELKTGRIYRVHGDAEVEKFIK